MQADANLGQGLFIYLYIYLFIYLFIYLDTCTDRMISYVTRQWRAPRRVSIFSASPASDFKYETFGDH